MGGKVERKTEELFRAILAKEGFYTADNNITVEEQKSENPSFARLLKTASKRMTGKDGFPEFIISSPEYPDLVVVVECKAEIAKHRSANLDQPADYALDGAIHYAKHLSPQFNVIAVGVSGVNQKELLTDFYLISKGSYEAKPLLNAFNQPVMAMEKFCILQDFASRDPKVEMKRVSELMAYARELHNFMRDFAKLSETEKPLLISGILIALSNPSFRAGYELMKDAELPKKLAATIRDEIDDADIPGAKKKAMKQAYSFIETHPTLQKAMKTSITPLQRMVGDIARHVYPFFTKTGEDIVGRFYGEFLRYTGGDGKGLGIVLTPRHITELFCDLANLTADDVVLDTCCGTGGFLVSAMHRMLNLSGITESKRAEIKKNQLVGVEEQSMMYALAASNMILRGDGKANLIQSSCFDKEATEQVKAMRPTVGFINPPYSQRGDDLHEFNFIEHMLDCLEKNGRGIAIVPMSCAIAAHPLKARILLKHTLEAVVSMPSDLFSPVGVVTCIMVFMAHKPHDSENFKTWFGYWKNDGFVKTKTEGRVDKKGEWDSIRKAWLSQYRERDVIPGLCVKEAVSHESEWCAEAYLETDYSTLTQADFEIELKKYALFNLMADIQGKGFVGAGNEA